MDLEFTQSARRHRIGRAHAKYVIATYEPVPTFTPRGEPGLEWVGADETGRELHVIGAWKGHRGALVIVVMHVFPTALNRRK